jgi:hypothetical protein
MAHGVLNLAVPLKVGELAVRPTQLDDKLVAQVQNYLSTHNVYAARQ